MENSRAFIVCMSPLCYQVVQQDHYKRCVKQLKRKSRDYYSFRIVITIIFFPLYLFLFFLKWSNGFTKNCHYCNVSCRLLPLSTKAKIIIETSEADLGLLQHPRYSTL